MASGPIATWTYVIGGLLILMNAMNIYTSCSEAMVNWGFGKYTCDELESGLLFNQSLLNIASVLTLIIAATAVSRNIFMSKIIMVSFIFQPILTTAFFDTMKINGRSMPNTIWCVDGAILGTFAIAAVMGLKAEQCPVCKDAVAADPKPVSFGALNKWAFGIGGLMALMNAGNLFMDCDTDMQNWGWGKYTCTTFDSAMLKTQSLVSIQCMVILIMAATRTGAKTVLLKLSAPILGCFLAQLIYWKPLVINGHTMPTSIYIVNAVVNCSFAIGVVMHKDASARHVEPTNKEPLLAI
jgi:hypothetical protein